MPETRGTVVLVDDSLFFMDKLKHQTETHGFTPRAVMFASAIEPAFAEETPVAIVVNLEAERLDPMDVIRRVHVDGALADVPVIAFAGHVQADLLAAAKELGATRVVSNGQIAAGLGPLLDEICGGDS